MTDINLDVLAEFKSITSVDAQTYFTNAQTFLSTSYNRIVAYYSGKQSQANQSDFANFTQLQKDTESILALFRLSSKQLSNLKFWLLLDHVEDIDSRLSSLAKINKWSKSSLTNFGYDPAQQALYTLKSRQTLERVSQDVLGTATPDDDWVDIALTNQLREEDYTTAGGVTVQLSFPTINNGITINSVVAVMVGNAIYGVDFDQKIQFDEDAEDLLILSPEDTVTQSLNILANLKKNSNPDFPDLGLQSSVIIGASRASLNFPVIIRQMTEAFASDDSFKNFTLLSIQIVDDSLQISFQVQTRLNETKTGTITV